MQYCSLEHRTLLPVTSTTGCCFCLGSIPSFFLELFLHWSPVAYWTPTNLGSSSFSVLSFYLFMLLMGFSRQEYWRGLPFPSPVDHVFHCIYVPHLFYPFICQWTFSLFPSLGSASEYCSLCEPYSWSYKFATLPQEYKSSQAIHGGMSMLAFQFNFIYEHLNEGHIIYSQNTDLMFTLHNRTGAWVKIS